MVSFSVLPARLAWRGRRASASSSRPDPDGAPVMNRIALKCAVAVLALAALAAPAAAQEATPAPAAAAPAPATPEQTAAAVEYLRAAQLTKGFEEMIPAFADQVRLRYVGQRPAVADVINDATTAQMPEFV